MMVRSSLHHHQTKKDGNEFAVKFLFKMEEFFEMSSLMFSVDLQAVAVSFEVS